MALGQVPVLEVLLSLGIVTPGLGADNNTQKACGLWPGCLVHVSARAEQLRLAASTGPQEYRASKLFGPLTVASK